MIEEEPSLSTLPRCFQQIPGRGHGEVESGCAHEDEHGAPPVGVPPRCGADLFHAVKCAHRAPPPSG